jgi:Mlc titration factor MtfA (ptsG expression regulator)
MRWHRPPNLTFAGWVAGVCLAIFGVVYAGTGEPIVMIAGVALALVGFLLFSWDRGFRQGILKEPIPEQWRDILRTVCPLYNALAPDQRKEFEQGVKVFLSRARFHSAEGARIDDEIRVTVAATAVMLVFARPDLDLPDVRHIVLRPGSFRMSRDPHGDDASGVLLDKRTMGLSARDFYFSLGRPWDGHNVVVHEFAHALDAMDGAVDGIPGFLGASLVRPWLDLVARERKKIRAGESLLDEYADTSEAEFFAVAVESYMEQPDKLRAGHPELFEFLDLSLGGISRFGPLQLSFQLSKASRTGRNDPCPCGSGRKFKKCCLA